MPSETLIPARDVVAHYGLDLSFIFILEEQGVLETSTVGPEPYLHPDQLAPLERLIRLHRELAVHVEDLDIVTHLLDRLEQAQEQARQLRNRLAFYEPEGGLF